jgi:uncharacterized membrane protein YqjE
MPLPLSILSRLLLMIRPENPSLRIQSLPTSRLSSSVHSLVHSVMNYGEARLRLIKAEASEILSCGIKSAIFIVVAILSLVAAYVTGTVALTLWISREFWQRDALPAALIVTLIHILIAVAAAFAVRRCFSGKHFFRHTFQEFDADKKCLHQTPISRN